MYINPVINSSESVLRYLTTHDCFVYKQSGTAQ